LWGTLFPTPHTKGQSPNAHHQPQTLSALWTLDFAVFPMKKAAFEALKAPFNPVA
jgi:hypothetical protein